MRLQSWFGYELYNYFRDYEPSTGRYVQSDPIGLRGGLNTYAYVLNNPVNSFDSNGLRTNRCPWAEPIRDCSNNGTANDDEGNDDWVEDSWGMHGGYVCWRRPDPYYPGSGYQCCYIDGVLAEGEGNYDYSMPGNSFGDVETWEHIWDDVIPDWDPQPVPDEVY